MADCARDVFDECGEILNYLSEGGRVSAPLRKVAECQHRDITKNDDGWYICQYCGDELRYDPNKPPVDLAQLYSASENQRRMVNRMKCLSEWLGTYNLPFEDDILYDFQLFIQKYRELYPERKNLINKENILFHMLRRRGIERELKLPKMEKTLKQNAEICRAIFDARD